MTCCSQTWPQAILNHDHNHKHINVKRVCSQGFIIRSWLHTLPFSVYLHYAFGMPFLSASAPLFYPSSYSNLSGTEIVVIAIAAIAAMAETTMIILFISDIPPWIIIWWSKDGAKSG